MPRLKDSSPGPGVEAAALDRCDACAIARDQLPNGRWWTARRAQNRKPATYRCPLCGERLPSLSEHILIAPEGDTSRRRHAHTACVLNARRNGRLPSRDEWLKATGQLPPTLASRATKALSRLLRRDDTD